MTLAQLITQLQKSGISLQLVDGQLIIHAPSEAARLSLQNEIRQYEAHLIDFLKTEHGTDWEPILPVTAQEDYELSHAQRRLWILHQLGDNKNAYNIPISNIIEGGLDIHAFRRAFETLIRRHESLRTRFVLVHSEPRQRIEAADIMNNYVYDDLCEQPHAESIVREYAEKEASRVFDLENGPLIRVCLFRIAHQRFIFLVTMHHIISDGWSVELLLKELLVLYNTYTMGLDNPLPPLRIHYKDYAHWQQTLLKSEQGKQQQAYWKQQLDGELPVLDLPTDDFRPAVLTNNGEKVSIVLDAVLTRKLRNISRRSNASLFMSLLAIVKTLFFRYTGQTDIIVGSPIAGRSHGDLEGQVGFYVNTLALRNQFDPLDSFGSFIHKVRNQVLDAYDHQLYPFDLLIDDLSVQRDMSRSPLFEVMVELQEDEYIAGETTEVFGLRVHNYDNHYIVAKFELSFSFVKVEDALALHLTYNKDIYSGERMRRMLEHFKCLTLAIADQPDKPLYSQPYLSREEWQLVTTVLPANEQNQALTEKIPGLKKKAATLNTDGHLLYLLDQYGQPVPIGVNGLIYMAVNTDAPLPDDQQESLSGFIQNPFNNGGLLYRTGEKGRWLSDGTLQYRGSEAEVLTVHGYQVESYYTRQLLLQHEEITQAVVLAGEEADQKTCLLAFYTGADTTSEQEFKNFLTEAGLPAYMLPDRFIHRDAMPVTAEGDIDIQQLLEEQKANLLFETAYEPPANELEEQLAAIWCEVLDRNSIGMNDNFFRITGNSIKATQIVSRMYKLGHRISIRSIFTCPTIRELAGLLTISADVPATKEVLSVNLQEDTINPNK